MDPLPSSISVINEIDPRFVRIGPHRARSAVFAHSGQVGKTNSGSRYGKYQILGCPIVGSSTSFVRIVDSYIGSKGALGSRDAEPHILAHTRPAAASQAACTGRAEGPPQRGALPHKR
jgi:hypothetical protein